MRVVLINPCLDRRFHAHCRGVGHLGLGYVAACLLRDGHSVTVIDTNHERIPFQGVLERVRACEPGLVGVTAMTHQIKDAGALCAAVKSIIPGCITMVGGAHSTALPERTLREFPGIDVAIRGEGEYTVCELAKAVEGKAARRDLAGIAGLAFRNGDEIRSTDARPPITDLDRLPFPAWELFPPDVAWPLYSGRGCPFRCAFCQRVLGGRIRLRSVDNVLAEIDALEARTGATTSWFQDETFGTNRKWTSELLDRLIERSERRGRVWHWKANSRANLVDAELYQKMARAGCRVLDFGVESGSPEVLKRIHKGITLAQARKAIRCAKQAGIRTNAFFIIGHPGETWRTAVQTVRFARRLGADDIAVGVMVPYPGTEVWELAKRGDAGYRLLSEDWNLYDKYFGFSLELKGLSHRQLELLQVLTYTWFYAGTGQLRRLMRFVWRFRSEAWRMLRRLTMLRSASQGADQPVPRQPHLASAKRIQVQG